MRNRLHLTIAIAALGVANPAAAQVPDVSPGIQFAGCWTPADGIDSKARTCVIPSNGTLRIFSVERDGKTSESTLRLDGEKTPLASEGCTGWEQARLTADGERVIVDAEVACGTDPKQRVQTAFSITPTGYFLQTSGKGFAMIPNAGLRLYVPVETYADIPAAARADVMRYVAEGERARMRIRDNKLSASDLLELEEMGVVAPVLDVVVAAAYPKSFVIDATAGFADPQLVETSNGGGRRNDRNCASSSLWMNGYPMLSMYDWELMYAASGYGTGASCPIGYFGYNRLARYGYGYGAYPYAYGVYGYGPFGGAGYGYPVVVVRPTPSGGASTNGGRAERGRGYTQTGGTSSSGAQPRNSVSQPSTASGASSTGSSGGTSSAGSSSAGSSSSGGSSSGEGARTAKPRSP